ncbi:hypothetical protein AB0G87_05745 [Streptomyces asoensis]|uniref:hypothetical protein n=1 Tax=Streptomyces asoensis TaxID=249586 RepID=UPI00340BF6DC
MTKARFQDLPRRDVGVDDQPAFQDLTGGKSTFPVIGDGAWVERQITEPLLREFLALLEAIQEELDSRWSGHVNIGRRVDQARRAHSYE